MSKQTTKDDDNLYRKTSDNMSTGSTGFFGKIKNLTNVNNNNGSENSNEDTYDELNDEQQQQERGFMTSKPKTLIDGTAKGIFSVGSGLFNGAKGIFEKPIQGAKQDGVQGFFKGVAKGVSGAVILPAVGVLEFFSYSLQGIVNTPLTILDAMKNQPKEQEQELEVVASKPIFFGVSLQESLNNSRDLKIPHLLSICIEYIEGKITTEGLFRINGSVALISEIQKSFEKGEIHSADDLSKEFTYEICGIFKAYFRYLPEALIPQDKAQELIKIHQSIANINDKVQPMKKVIHSISDPNYTILYLCTNFLYKISQHSKENLMTASNLSIIYGISWLRPNDTDIQEIANANTIIFILISNFKSIFTKEPNLSLL